MKVAIIMTCYNHEKYIAEAIESIINQEYQHWVLYIGNDASTDNTEKIINKYASTDERIKIWTHKENIWLVENMNFLSQKVDEDIDIIMFLEGDDKYNQHYLSEVNRIYHENPSIECTVFKYQTIGKGLKYPPFFKRGIQIITLEKLIQYWSSPICSFWSVSMTYKLFKYTFPQKDLDPTQKVFIPFDLQTRYNIIPNHNLFYSEKIWLIYRIHENNNSIGTGKRAQLLYQSNLLLRYILSSRSTVANSIIFSLINLNEAEYQLLWNNKKASIKSLIVSFRYGIFLNLKYKLEIAAWIIGLKRVISKIIILTRKLVVLTKTIKD